MPALIDDDQSKTLIKINICLTIQHIAKMIHISHMNVVKHFKPLGYVIPYNVRMPNDLAENKFVGSYTCDFLLKSNKNYPITGDEKQID